MPRRAISASTSAMVTQGVPSSPGGMSVAIRSARFISAYVRELVATIRPG